MAEYEDKDTKIPKDQETDIGATDAGGATRADTHESLGDEPDAEEPPGESEQQKFAAGTKVGRYLILEQLGHGGMGVVFKAYDPELDRNIALKLLRVRRNSESKANRARSRLLREAKALAQLSHPNVVAAYDVGTMGNDVFIAMELIEGLTLQQWLRHQPRTWQDIVAVMVAAGRGIAAAHRAGLIHRDIKPDNIVIGNDQRVRVLDFGLARASAQDEINEAVEDQQETKEQNPALSPTVGGEILSVSSGLHTPITMAGVVVGTPGYMAPEQYLGMKLDEKTDQYSFCVTLFEALYKVRPHSGSSYRNIKNKVLTQEVAPAPPGAKVPSWLRRILLRGLSRESSLRYCSMEVLLDQLCQDPYRLWRRLGVLTAIVFLVVASFSAAAIWQAHQQALCQGSEKQLRGSWDENLREKTRQRFLATGKPHAQDTFDRVSSLLDQYALGWAAMQTEACEATQVLGTQSEKLLDLRMACLQRRLSELSSLTHLFAKESDSEILDKAVQASLALTRLRRCADQKALLAAYPPPDNPNIQRQLTTLRAQLNEARALKNAGKYQEGLAIVSTVEEAARDLDYPPLHAKSLYLLGELQVHTGAAAAAEISIRQSIVTATRARDYRVFASALNSLVFIVGYLQARYDEALTLETIIEAARQGLTNPQEIHARSLNNLGTIYAKKGETQKAVEYLEQARKLWEKSLGPDHPQLAYSLINLGNVVGDLGENEKGISYYQRAQEILASKLGAEHPLVTVPLNNLGATYAILGQTEKASRCFRRALSIKEKILGASHPELAFPLTGLGFLLINKNQAQEALPYLERALSIRNSHAGDPGDLGETKFALARTLWSIGHERKRAIQLARQAQKNFAQAGAFRDAERKRVGSWLKKPM